MLNLSSQLLAQLQDGAERADEGAHWPAESWNALMREGVGRWSIPRVLGGDELPQSDQLSGSEIISANCLTTAFILSQREAAIRHVLRGPDHLKQRYLPNVANGKSFITIGLSQLTTSRQHQAPSLKALRLSETEFLLDGEIPWVTGVPQATAVVIGATFDSGEQALFLLPLDAHGVRLGEPLSLSSLRGSLTCSIHCDKCSISEDFLLAGPKPQVLGGGGGGGLETSCLAIGLSRAAASYLESQAHSRAELEPVANTVTSEVYRLHRRLHSIAENPSPDEVLALRADCTLLALRATQAALLFAKGTGFVRPHPAQRWARQALFFLVWSCPRSVSEQVWRGLFSPT